LIGTPGYYGDDEDDIDYSIEDNDDFDYDAIWDSEN